MPELRRDPLTGTWVIFPLGADQAAHYAEGRAEGKALPFSRSPKSCPLCPGSEVHTPAEVYAVRPGHGPAAQHDAPGWSLRVIPHKFPALVIEGDLDRRGQGLYDRMHGIGAHEVLIETPDHGRQLRDLSEGEIEQVLWAYRYRILDLRRDTRFRYIAVFKHHGQRAGANLAHSHSQLVALPLVPRVVSEELAAAERHYTARERCLLCDIARQEIEENRRVIFENSGFVAFAPYASRSPFETWIVPKAHRPSYEDTASGEYLALAGALRQCVRKLSLALDDPCYSFVLHNAPFTERPPPFFHWHIEVLPVLGGGLDLAWGSGLPLNPTLPEDAAQYLRDLQV